MDSICGSEISFPDGFAFKPQRTFTVNTNAPLHSSGFEVLPSGGVATFPDSSSYADRIIVWRAVGQKLYLEERSLLVNIQEGSICIDFSRTPILPGTSITIFEENILSIVVPTASSIHRFYARLSTKKGQDTLSILARLTEDELIRKFHTCHVLTTNGRALRASVTQHVNYNTIAYCTAEGQIVVVTLKAFDDESEKHDEVVLNETGLFKRLMRGGMSSEFYSDVCSIKKRSFRQITSPIDDLIFAITRNGQIKSFNASTKSELSATLDLNNYSLLYYQKSREHSENDTIDSEINVISSEVNYSIKAYAQENEILLVVGCFIRTDGSLPHACIVHLVKANNEEMTHLASFDKNVSPDDRLIDYSLLRTDESIDSNEVKKESLSNFSLTALFKSASMEKDYVISRIAFELDWTNSTCRKRFDWHEITKFRDNHNCKESSKESQSDDDELNTTPYQLPPESSIETIQDAVFNTDIHSFDVVLRAVQVVCENQRGTASIVRYGNWKDLINIVNVYITSPEFNRKFHMKLDRNIRLKFGRSEDTQHASRKAFWWALLGACEELDHAARGVISISPMQVENDLKIMTIIHMDRVTVLEDFNADLLEVLLESCGKGTAENDVDVSLVHFIKESARIAGNRIALMNHEKYRNELMRTGGFVEVEEDVKDFKSGSDFEEDGDELDIPSLLHVFIHSLAKRFIKMANYDNSKPFGPSSRCIFGGSFTRSIVAMSIRRTVEKRLFFALTLRGLLTAISNKSSQPFGDNESYRIELREIIRIYRELLDQLDVKIEKNSAKMSLCTWLISDDDGLSAVRAEGGYGPDGVVPSDGDYNSFLTITTECAVRALLSTSEVLVLARRLVYCQQFKTLKLIMTDYINETKLLKPVIQFYRGIAYSGCDQSVKALASFEGVLEPFMNGNTALRKAVFHLLPRVFVGKPGVEPIDQLDLADFYLTVVRFLQEHGHTEEVVKVATSAIDSLSVDEDSMQLIANTLFTHLTTRSEWSKALKLVLTTTFDAASRRASICELMTLMISNGEWNSIVTMSYGQYEHVVEEFLRDGASRQPPSEKRHLFELLYSYFMFRNDYRMAACSMYEFAQHIKNAPQMDANLLRRRRDALAAVLNLQDVISIEPDNNSSVYDDWNDTNLVFPKSLDDNEIEEDVRNTANKAGALKKSNKMNVDNQFSMETELEDELYEQTKELEDAIKSKDGNSKEKSDINYGKRRQLCVISKNDICKEFLICSARVGLLISGVYDGIPPTEPEELFEALVDVHHFDSAFDIARQFDLNPFNLYFALVREAIMIDALQDDLVIEAAATRIGGWVRENRRHCNSVATSDDHWAVVRGLLDAAHSSRPNDSRAFRGAVEGFLSHNVPIPYWLYNVYEKEDSGDFLRCLIDYSKYNFAFKAVINMVEKETDKINSTDSRCWLPFNAIDELMKLSGVEIQKSVGKNMDELKKMRKATDEKLMNYFKKVESFERAQQMTIRFLR